MNRLFISTLAVAAAAVVVTSCGEDRNGWTIEGTIAGAADSTLYIEECPNVAWLRVDSVVVGENGDFVYTAPEPVVDGAQKRFRVRMGNRAVEFTVNGTEVVRLTADAKDFGRKYRLTGNAAVEAYTAADSLVNEATARLGVRAALSDPTLAAALYEIISNDSTCIASSSVITRTIDGRPVFDFNDPKDLRFVGAVANKYNELRPNDPRGVALIAAHRDARKRVGKTSGRTVEAPVTGRPTLDFVRPDVTGKTHDLNAILDRGGVTVLNLTCYGNRLSSKNTRALGDVYAKYKDRGLEIFQVGFDPNEALWRQNAAGMPWTAVYNSPSANIDILVSYQADPINGAPVSYIFNADGDLVTRIDNPDDLDAELAKLF